MSQSSSTSLPMASDAIPPIGTSNPFSQFDLMESSSTPVCPSRSKRVTRSKSRDQSPKKFLQNVERNTSDKRRRMIIPEELEEGQISDESVDERPENGVPEPEKSVDLNAIFEMQGE